MLQQRISFPTPTPISTSQLTHVKQRNAKNESNWRWHECVISQTRAPDGDKCHNGLF